MPEIKCKSCGAHNIVPEGTGVTICEYCGREQTLTKSKSETIINLFNYANDLRRQCEFDKAAEKYEKILEMELEDAEAHWGLVLCKYGIEYVEESASRSRIPTCHRAQYESVLTDGSYLSALRYADADQKRCYTKDGEEIAALQRKILQVVYNEKPFDVFICYKEKDSVTGERTRDSVIATKLYYALVDAGFKVFFAPITLENKLGQEYEPYIFAALNSSKVMLVLGTKAEYMQAVWVRNEWSRFLKLMKAEKKTMRLLIPCYQEMDPYDMPGEFAHLQAKNMGDFTFSLDITSIIKKVIEASKGSGNEEKARENDLETTIRRAFICLEDGDFNGADKYLDRILEKDSKNPRAYLGKAMISHKVRFEEDLEKVQADLFEDPYYKRAMRFSDDKHRLRYVGYRHASFYNRGKEAMARGDYKTAKSLFEKTGAYLDAQQLARECDEAVGVSEAQQSYNKAVALQNQGTLSTLQTAVRLFTQLGSFADSEHRREQCTQEIQSIQQDKQDNSEKNMLIGELRHINDMISNHNDNQERIVALQKWKKRCVKARWAVAVSWILMILSFILGYESDTPPPAFIVGFIGIAITTILMSVWTMQKWLKVNRVVPMSLMYTIIVPIFMFIGALYAQCVYIFKPLTKREKELINNDLNSSQYQGLIQRRDEIQQQLAALR